MTTKLAGLANFKTETFFERHAWKALLGVIFLIGFFGVGDMLGGASDLQNGESVMMHSLTGTSWNELRAASPNAANLIDMKFRTDGASLTAIALLMAVICLTGFRRGERWAWYALWVIPVWIALSVLIVWNAVRQPSYGTPIPTISGSIFFLLWVTLLALSYRRFFQN